MAIVGVAGLAMDLLISRSLILNTSHMSYPKAVAVAQVRQARSQNLREYLRVAELELLW